MTRRSYNQFCALAYALDVVGERWTMLIVRELLVGPRRFTDLVDGLPGISTNLLSERLKILEEQGVLCRRVLPPPAGSTVYELTPLGRDLDRSLQELGKWGVRFMPQSLDGVALPSCGAMALAIKAFFRPEQALAAGPLGLDETYELHLDNEVLRVQVKEDEVDVQQGAAPDPDVILHAPMQVFVGLFAGQLELDQAVAAQMVQIEGDEAALRRFLALFMAPVGH